MYRRGGRRGNPSGRNSARLEGQIRSLKESIRLDPKLIPRPIESISPPDETISLRGERWIRKGSIEPEGTGDWDITADLFKDILAGSSVNSHYFIKRLRFLLLASSEAGPSELLVLVNSLPSAIATSACFTRFSALGSPGSSGAIIEVDMGHAMKASPNRTSSTTLFARISRANSGGVQVNSLFVDALLDVVISPGSFGLFGSLSGACPLCQKRLDKRKQEGEDLTSTASDAFEVVARDGT